MRSKPEVVAKLRKFKKLLRKRILSRGLEQRTSNCKYWLDEVSLDEKCVFELLENTGTYRSCPDPGSCSDFCNQYSEQDLNVKYREALSSDPYLIKNFPALYWVIWFMDGEDNDIVEEGNVALVTRSISSASVGRLSLAYKTNNPKRTFLQKVKDFLLWKII